MSTVLEALKAQRLPREQWELVVVDNCSEPALQGRIDLSWHPQARCFREEILGTVPGRLKALRESSAPLIVNVDDDNVLASDYLEKAMDLAANKPWVGVWSASIEGDFERVPRSWLGPFIPFLAIWKEEREVWSNDYQKGFLPMGPGMVIQRKVFEHYADQIGRDPRRRSLGRTGTNLMAAEDTDLGLCACGMGLACGRSPLLQVRHLIPARRVTFSYLIRITLAVLRSQRILYLSLGLIRLNRIQILKKFFHAFLWFPWRCFRRGLGEALYPFVEATSEWQAHRAFSQQPLHAESNRPLPHA